MALFRSFRRAIRTMFGKAPALSLLGEGEMPASRDTLSVIHDLTHVAKNNPEAIEIYMALGNLFRAQGDIERAVLIREGLMARAGLGSSFKARACFELGQDYRRAGVVDRALAAYDEARKLGYNPEAVTAELAKLFAGAGNFAKAADEYANLGHHIGEAHYLMRAAEELAETGEQAKARRLFKKAVRVYPGSADAWSALILTCARAGEWRKVTSFLKQALYRVAPNLQFLLLETLYQESRRRLRTIEAVPGPVQTSAAVQDAAPFEADSAIRGDTVTSAEAEEETREDRKETVSEQAPGAHEVSSQGDATASLDGPEPQTDIVIVPEPTASDLASSITTAPAPPAREANLPVRADRPRNVDRSFAASLCQAVIPVLEKQPLHILLHYYGALLFKESQDIRNAELWLSKALVVQPNFWAARMELLYLAALNDEFSPSLVMQVEYFAHQMQHINRFICTVCGLRQNHIFYLCPRCGSWHTISYRLSLQD